MTRANFRVLRGMRDITYADAARLTCIEDVFAKQLTSFGFEEIRLPVMEAAELFNRGLGQATDAVMKEMYEFRDRDGEQVALRPEGTASCVRAVVNNNLCREDRPRFWYNGLMFRHERPQAGRYRQFHQVGAEIFGFGSADADVELIAIADAVFKDLRIDSSIEFEINTIGSAANRAAYRSALVDYLEPFRSDLDEDSQNRLSTNPLRILDSKHDKTQEVLEEAPDLLDYVDADSRGNYELALAMLDELDIGYRCNTRLVRGFDYYTGIVFEWKTDAIGSQDAICAGGRYDGLVPMLGGADVGAVGFAAGIERIALLHESANTDFDYRSSDVYVIPFDESLRGYANTVAATLRAQTGLRVRMHLGAGKLRAKLRWADRSGAAWAVLVGEDEKSRNEATLKWLRTDDEQLSLPVSELSQKLIQIRRN